MVCSDCGREIRPDARFCDGCGAPQHANVLFLQGNHDEAVELSLRGIEMGKLSNRLAEASGLAVLARCRLAMGEREAARELAEEALAKSEAFQGGQGQIAALAVLAEIELTSESGSLARSTEYLDRAEGRIDELGLRIHHPRALELRADVATREGDLAAAVAHLEHSRSVFDEMGAPIEVERIDALLAQDRG